MTFREAMRAMKFRVPVKLCGPTAVMYGALEFQRIAEVSYWFDDYGRLHRSVDCIEERNGRQISRGTHDMKDVEVSDTAPEILRRQVYEEEAK